MHYPGDLSHLGLPVGEYRPRWHTYLLTAIGVGVFFTALIGLVLHQTGLSVMTGSEWTIVIAVALFGVVGVLTFGIQALSNKRRRFLVFDHGFVDQRGNQTEVYTWDDIKATRSKSLEGNGLVMIDMRLDCHDGRKFKFEGMMSNSRAAGAAQSPFRPLGKLDMLDIIMNSVLPRRRADARARLVAGEQVAFGQLAISQSGLHTRRRMLPWHQLSGVKMRMNSLAVWQIGHRRRWGQWDLSAIPDLPILIELVGQRHPAILEQLDEQPATANVSRTSGTGTNLLMCAVLVVLIGGGALAQQYNCWRSPSWQTNRARDLITDERHEAALAYVNRAIKLNPGYARAYVYRSMVYYRQDDLDQTFADLNRALRLRPGYDYALLRRGAAYYKRGVATQMPDDIRRSVADFSSIIAQDPAASSDDWIVSNAYFRRGRSYMMLGLRDEAISDLRPNLTLPPGDEQRRLAEEMLRELNRTTNGIRNSQ